MGQTKKVVSIRQSDEERAQLDTLVAELREKQAAWGRWPKLYRWRSWGEPSRGEAVAEAVAIALSTLRAEKEANGGEYPADPEREGD